MAIDIVGEGNANIPSAMREFFYVDLERVRSYYAQANRGIIESIVTKDAKILSGDLKATIFGIGGSGSLSRTGSHDETRSLQELTYTLFEELLEERDLITDIGETFSDPKSWGDGVVHNTLREGQIIRFTGDIRVLDPQFFGNQVTHVLGLATALAGLQVGEIPGQPAIPPIRKGGATRASQGGKSPEQQRERIKRELVQGILGMSVAQIEEFCNLFSSFSHNVISMRAFPCGTSRPEFHFSGTLLSRTEYIQAEREELYSRYSNKLSNWTAEPPRVRWRL